jgi:hypothetical protein
LDGRNIRCKNEIGILVMYQHVVMKVRSIRKEERNDKPAVEISAAEAVQVSFSYVKTDVIVLLAPKLTIGMC